jgi:hypothetical protein
MNDPSARPSVPANLPTSLPAALTPTAASDDPILCRHCGRTASNGISCEGSCVADSGY